MTAKEAMDIGMQIADRYKIAALDILRVKPDATHEEMLHGTHVWLGAQIMQEICGIMAQTPQARWGS